MTRLLLASLICPLGLTAADPTRTLSVCEAIATRLEHNREIVVVRGQIKAGGHGNYMIASAKCSYRLVTRGVVWPNVINLRFPNSRSPDPLDHAPFQPDLRAVQTAQRSLAKAGITDADIEVATYVGLLVTFPDLDHRVSPGISGAPKLGFGPAGLEAPVQLLIKTIGDVSITKSAQNGHGEK